jgi:hypothetical protein
MNVLIVDTDKINLTTACNTLKDCVNKSGGEVEWRMIPKGIDIIQDISVDWMKMIRDRLDEKIKALENSTK